MRQKYRSKRVRCISDAELLLADLSTDDANAIPNIVREKLPDGVGVTNVIRVYSHARYPGEKIFCCVCGAQQHKAGFHVERSDNKETTLGNCCAAKKTVLGPEYVAAALRSREERTRQSYLRDIHAFQPVALRIVQGQMSKPWRELARGIRTARFGLRETLGGPAWDVLSQAAASGSPLTVPERVLVSKWTDRLEAGRVSEGDKDRYAWVTVDVGMVPGALLFSEGDPTDIVSDLDRVLKNFMVISRNTDAHQTSELRQLVQMLRGGRDGLKRLHSMMRALDEFFSVDSIKFVVGWHRLNCSVYGHNFTHKIKGHGGTLVNETMGRTALKTPIMEPNGDLIAMLAAA